MFTRVKFLIEAIYLSFGVNDALFTGEEWVTVRTDICTDQFLG
jgi:hypothetical protein